MASERQKVLILGGGFGGIKTALELADDERFAVILVSDQKNFRYYPALYRAATGGSPVASSIPLQEIFKDKSVKVLQGSAKTLDGDEKIVRFTSGKILPYDFLVIALGVVTNYFGIKGLKEYSYGIKTLGDAQEFRDHLHQVIMEKGKPDLNYVVIGGGATGVELAGALPAYLKFIMRNHGVEQKTINVSLIEAESRVVPHMNRHYSSAIAKRLRRLGVKLYLNYKVMAETADTLQISGHGISSHSVVWTAGVTNHPFFSANDFPLSKDGKVLVDDFLQTQNGIYVIGDNARTTYSGMAQTALYDGVFVAQDLKCQLSGKLRKTYKPKKPIYITPVGPHWAAVQWGKVQIYGWLGWMLRRVADFMGYRDYEPWWKASKNWMAAEQTQEDCPVCAKK